MLGGWWQLGRTRRKTHENLLEAHVEQWCELEHPEQMTMLSGHKQRAPLIKTDCSC